MSGKYIFKYILVGDSSVGKSCLLVQFKDKYFDRDHIPTVGVEFAIHPTQLGNDQIKLQIWDTAGQGAFRELTNGYYRGCAGVFFVYEVTSKHSFTNIKTWMGDARTYSNPNITAMLIGNKADWEGKREVSFEEGQLFARKHGMLFAETSAKTGVNVEQAFMNMTKKIYDKISLDVFDSPNDVNGIRVALE